MAQSLYHLPSEQALVECRAIVFSHDINRWIEVGEPNVYSRIQLICIRSPGSTAVYKVLARLESTGTVRNLTEKHIFMLQMFRNCGKLRVFTAP